MEEYLKQTEIIDWNHPVILSKAKDLSVNKTSVADVAKSCFEWVRDNIRHIDDYNIQTVSCSASEVITSGSGICYAKSHLLAALLRANRIPAGFCYQRLSINDDGNPYCLHGLNAVFLPKFGWYRIDSRGNREGINAQFSPPKEQLAFQIQFEKEIDFQEILSEPLSEIIEALKKYKTKDELWNNLPDAKLL
ncbi:transglutaminase family protein [Desulfonema ishimotonii]|uniref:Transglutaminase family protein n=1 Tax=Desulfonema ishimotonii TaxID=45657 RepID=A0A401FXE3_9BACT|nr:transglutaminase family protein [Desulfonema ishimotonii]GBC61647.1 transglutaminase family protein [Desulfonema ishimotonii]